MKQVYLIAILMLLCLAPMPYGYFQLVRFVAIVALWNLLPKRFFLPTSGTAHSSGVNTWVFGKQRLDVLGEGVRRIDGIEPVGDIAEMGIKPIGCDLACYYPLVGHTCWNTGIYYNVCIPKTSMMSADVSNDRNASQPTAHIFKLWNHKTSADSFLCCAIIHITVEPRKCSQRGYFHRLPYRRHRRFVVLSKVFQDILIFRPFQFFLQALEVFCKHCIVFCKCNIHEPECPIPFSKYAYHLGTNSDLYMLYCRKYQNTKFFIETIKTHDLRESGAWLENMPLLVCFHQPPIARQSEITDGIKRIPSLCVILNLKPTLFKNVYLLLNGKQWLGVSHKHIYKKCPALVRYIPCGREAVAGSIVGKDTDFFRNSQMFYRKSA